MKRSLVLGLGLLVSAYAAGCGGSEPADTAQQPPAAGTAPPAAQQGAQATGGSSVTGTITFAGNPEIVKPVQDLVLVKS